MLEIDTAAARRQAAEAPAATPAQAGARQPPVRQRRAGAPSAFPLLRKELRALRPFLVLVALFMGLGFGFELLTEVPHLRPLAATVDEYVASEAAAALGMLVILFALASGLLVREYDEGTLEFLDTLPVSRSRVFVAKVFAALLVPVLLIALDIGIAVLLQALSRNSLDSSFHVRFLATAAGLRMCQAVIFLSLGLALSFLRRFGWLALLLLIWTYLLLHESFPQLRMINTIALSEPAFEHGRWLIPWRPLAVQLSLAALLLGAAYLLFLGAGDHLLRGWQRCHESRWGRGLLFTGGSLLAVIAAAVAFQLGTASQDLNADSEVTIAYPAATTARCRTEHYEFIYPSHLARRAEPLIAAADAAHETVRSLLGAPAGNRIVVDLTGSSSQHAGRAYWEKVQMDLSHSEDPDELLAVLAHETAHVYLDQRSDSRLSEHFGSARFFHEGVASYVEYRRFRSADDLEQLWFVAAVMRARRQVDAGLLIDDDRWRARYDSDLVYPLGEVFIEALVECYGEAAVGTLAAALARPGAPQHLTGVELWRDAFQACGYSLENVLTAFYSRLDQQVQQQREAIDRLPRLRAAVRAEGSEVVVEVLGDEAEGWHSLCRFRQAEDSPDRQYMFGVPRGSREFAIARGFFPAGQCWYQVGLSDGTRLLWEPWQRVRLQPAWD